MPSTSPPPLRSTAARIAAVRERLMTDADAWVASADAGGEAYLIPLSFQWDGTALTFATPAASRTARNLRRVGRTRVSLESTRDVVLIDGPVLELGLDADPALTAAFAATCGFDPRESAARYVLIRLTPERIQTWRSEPELTGRDVMRGGRWLTDDPAPDPAPAERDWNAEVIATFRANAGVVPTPYPDPDPLPMLLLHTIGAKSGREHIVPMRGLPEGDTLFVFASAHGSDRNPDWYHNLRAHPDIEVERGTSTLTVHATEMLGAERDEILARWVARVPLVADVLAKTSRPIPVIRLERRPT